MAKVPTQPEGTPVTRANGWKKAVFVHRDQVGHAQPLPLYWIIGYEKDGGYYVGFRDRRNDNGNLYTGRRSMAVEELQDEDFVYTGETYQPGVHNSIPQAPKPKPPEDAGHVSNAWVSPGGSVYRCDYGQHGSTAVRLCVHVLQLLDFDVEKAGVYLHEKKWITLHTHHATRYVEGWTQHLKRLNNRHRMPCRITDEQEAAVRAFLSEDEDRYGRCEGWKLGLIHEVSSLKPGVWLRKFNEWRDAPAKPSSTSKAGTQL